MLVSAPISASGDSLEDVAVAVVERRLSFGARAVLATGGPLVRSPVSPDRVESMGRFSRSRRYVRRGR